MTEYDAWKLGLSDDDGQPDCEQYRVKPTVSGTAVVRRNGSYAEFLAEAEAEVCMRNLLAGITEERDYEWAYPLEADDEPECCPECGYPKDGSSGHGHCDHPCHAAS